MNQNEQIISFTLHPIHPRLLNWGRWAGADYRHKQEHCGSAEWRYRRQADQGSTSLSDVDLWDAVKLEKIVTRLPRKHRTAIIGWYAARDSITYITRRIGIHYARFDEHMRAALNMVENNLLKGLDKSSNICKI